MVKVIIVAAGKITEGYLKSGVAEYLNRLERFCRPGIIEVPDEKAPENLSDSEEDLVRRREGERLLSRLRPGFFVVALDISGKKMDSEGFAHMINRNMIAGRSDMAFIIGGSLGLDEKVLKRADLRLSMSDMTFPHQLTRLIILEQIYRALKIIHGEPYHK